MPRVFDGTDDDIRISPGAIGPDLDAFSIAICCRITSTADTSYQAIMNLSTSGGQPVIWIERNDVTKLGGGTFDDSYAIHDSTIAWDDSTGWAIVVYCEAAGASLNAARAPRFALYNYGTRTWTYANVSPATNGRNPNTFTGGFVQFGEWQAADDFTGLIEWAGVWNKKLTDAEMESLIGGIPACLRTAPKAFWIMRENVAGTAKIYDITGGAANETTGGAGSAVGTYSPPWNTAPGNVIHVERVQAAAGTETTDSGTAALVITPSGTEFQSFTYVDSGTVPMLFTASAVETMQDVDSGTALVDINGSAVETFSGFIDEATVPLTFTASATEQLVPTDSGTALVTITPSATELHTTFDADTAPVVITPTFTEERQMYDTEIAAMVITASATDIAAFTEVGTPKVVVTPSAFEFQGGSGVVNTMYFLGTAGIAEAFSRSIVRTSANMVYIFAADDSTSQKGTGAAYIRALKADQVPIPTSFTEKNSAARPVATGGSSNTISVPDCRLDKNGIVHMIYEHYENQDLYYAQFNTNTDTWNLVDEVIVTAVNRYTHAWKRFYMAAAIILDNNEVAHVVYGNGTSVFYRDRVAGTWSSATTIANATETNPVHFQMAAQKNGDFHVVWLSAPDGATSTVRWAKKTGATWGSAETVSSSSVMNNTNGDQGPSLVLGQWSNIPYVLFLEDTTQIMRIRSRVGGTWGTVAPPGYNAHTPMIHMRGDKHLYLMEAHSIGGATLMPSYAYSLDEGASWSAEIQLYFGGNDIDGSVCTRWDYWRDNNPNIIDCLWYDERHPDGDTDHFPRLYYMALLPTGEVSEVTVNITPSGTDTQATGQSDAATVSIGITPSAVEVQADVDAATVPVLFTASGTDVPVYVDTGVVPFTITPSATDISQTVDSSTVGLLLTPSAVDTAQFIDAATIPLKFTASALELPIYADSGTTRLTFTPSGVELAQYVDTATAYYRITPSFTSVAEGDLGEVYIDIQPNTAFEAISWQDTLLSATIRQKFSGNLSQKFSANVNMKWAFSATTASAYTLSGASKFAAAIKQKFGSIYHGRGEL